VPAQTLNTLTDGMPVKVAGLVLVRQRPGTASGICFITIEDETGCANLVVFQKLFDKYRKEILQSRLLMVEGTLQREGEVIHVIVKHCYNLTGLLRELSRTLPEEPLGHADERRPFPASTEQHKEDGAKVFYGGRNFK